MKTKLPILRQNKVEELAEVYFQGFDEFQRLNPGLPAGILQPKYDEWFYEKHLVLTRIKKRSLWKRI
jgi:hypothetical protein